jgi:steroid Delta-isomerase
MSPLERYISFMESVADFDLGNIEAFIAKEIHFVDPFNDTTGIDCYRAIIEDMRAQLSNLQITVLESAMVGDASALIRWQLGGKLSAFKHRPWQVTGCSSVRFSESGQVIEHVDYWDAAGQLYESMPLIGSALKYLRHKLAVKIDQ